MIAGPEINRLLRNFEGDLADRDEILEHHQSLPSFQKAFRAEVKALVRSFEELGNPFMEDCGFLVSLSSKDIMPAEVSEAVNTVESIGKTQYNDFVRDVFEKRERKITEPIRKNKLPTFATPGKKGKGTTKTSMAALKSDCSLFVSGAHISWLGWELI